MKNPLAWLRPSRLRSRQTEGDSSGRREITRRLWAGASNDILIGERNPDLHGVTKYRSYRTLQRLVPIISGYSQLVLGLAAKAKFEMQGRDDTDMERIERCFHEGLRTNWAQTQADMAEAVLYGYSVNEWATERVGGIYRLKLVNRIPQVSIYSAVTDDDQRIDLFEQFGSRLNPIRRWQTFYIVNGHTWEGEGALANCAQLGLEYINQRGDLFGAIRSNLRDIPNYIIPGADLEGDGTPLAQDLLEQISNPETAANPASVLPSEVHTIQAPGETRIAASARKYEAIQRRPVPINDNDRLMLTEREIGLALGAQTMLLGSDGVGSNALARTQATMLYGMLDGGLERCADEIERVVKVLFDFNGWPSDEIKVTVDNSEWVDPVDLADMLQKVQGVDRDNYGDAIDDVLERAGLKIENAATAGEGAGADEQTGM